MIRQSTRLVINHHRTLAFSAFAMGLVVVVALQPTPVRADIVHQYTFNGGNANDAVGGSNGVAMGGVTFSGGQAVFDGADGFIELGGPAIAINTFSEASFEAWFTIDENTALWPRVFDFGDTLDNGQGADYIFYSAVRNGAHGAAITNVQNGNRSRAGARKLRIDLDAEGPFVPQYLHEQDTARAGSRNDGRREGGVLGIA